VHPKQLISFIFSPISMDIDVCILYKNIKGVFFSLIVDFFIQKQTRSSHIFTKITHTAFDFLGKYKPSYNFFFLMKKHTITIATF
jgi:hypothetical protein